jgi:hypothetical protein
LSHATTVRLREIRVRLEFGQLMAKRHLLQFPHRVFAATDRELRVTAVRRHKATAR